MRARADAGLSSGACCWRHRARKATDHRPPRPRHQGSLEGIPRRESFRASVRRPSPASPRPVDVPIFASPVSSSYRSTVPAISAGRRPFPAGRIHVRLPDVRVKGRWTFNLCPPFHQPSPLDLDGTPSWRRSTSHLRPSFKRLRRDPQLHGRHVQLAYSPNARCWAGAGPAPLQPVDGRRF